MICVSYLVKESIAFIKAASILGCWNSQVRARSVVKVSLYHTPSFTAPSDDIYTLDFLALENILSGESELGHEQYDEDDHETNHRRSRAPDPANAGNRFSRYLRFAKRRHRGEEEPDPTDPYMPPAPESPILPGRPSPSP